MINVGDALVKVGVDTREFDRGMKDVQGQLQKTSDEMNRQLKYMGAAMMGMGLAITGALGLAAHAAAKEQAGIVLLQVALKNVGISYDEVKDSLEGTIDAQQQKTSISDTLQRQSIAMLVRATGDLNKALELNALAMDIAIGLGVDLATADRMLMYAMEGSVGMLRRYGIQIKDNATAEEAMAALHQQFAGSAEAYGKTVAGQYELLKNNIGDVKEALGMCLLEAIRPFLEDLSKLANWFKDLDPKWQKFIAFGGLATGVFLTLGGAMMLFASQMPKVIKLLNMLRLANLRAAVSATVHAIASAAKAVAGIPVVGPFLVAGAIAATLAGITYGVMKAKTIVATLAKGGKVKKPTVAVLGEEGEEAVLPLTKPARVRELIDQIPLLKEIIKEKAFQLALKGMAMGGRIEGANWALPETGVTYLPRGAMAIPVPARELTPIEKTIQIDNNFYISRIIIREEADIKKVAVALEDIQEQKNRARGLTGE